MNPQIQQSLDPNDPYQSYIFLLLDVFCYKCNAHLDILPELGEEYSWDWIRSAADKTRNSNWWIAPFVIESSDPMICLCPNCREIENIESGGPANQGNALAFAHPIRAVADSERPQ
ncbi:MAG: hypothetical protein HC904_17380 [Blastochloris sp.]|nr:hypothetical protein [Blastochloris sp.]